MRSQQVATLPWFRAGGGSIFAALKRIGYTGGVSCACSWGKKEEFEKNLDTAIATLKSLEAQA